MSFILLLFLLNLLFSLSDSACDETYLVYCDKLSDVEKSGRKQWTNLVIGSTAGGSNKEILSETSLDKFVNLEELYIVNRLQEIHPNAFQQLQNLLYVNIYKNNLKIVKKEMFSNIPNLYKIELEFNKIQGIDQDAFNTIPNLRVLNVGNNQLNHIGKNIYNIDSLKRLTLANNILSTISQDAFSSNLEILDLSSNSFRRLGDKLFANLNKLKELNLSRNKLKKLEGNYFTGLTSLFKLDVSHNEIDTIEVKTFQDLKSMKILQLAHNNLKLLKPDLFPKSSNLVLQSLRLDHNKFTFLSLDVLNSLPALRRISLGGNPWQCICLEYMQQELNKLNISLTPCDNNHYFSGSNPNCMEFRTDECVENVEFVGEDYPKLYFIALKNFSYDCP